MPNEACCLNCIVEADGKPWHGLGTELDHPATAREAIAAAQLDYKVEKCPMTATVGDKTIDVPNTVATVRTDTNRVLGTVGDGYQVLQNLEAFDFMDTLVGEKLAIYRSAGALMGGSRIWMLVQLPKNMVIAKDDVVEKYLLLANAHDGTMSLRCFFTGIRR